MKNAIIAAGAILLFAGAGIASAQQTVVITREQQPVIQRYVVEQHVAPAELPSNFDLAVGAQVPDTVELHTIQAPDVDTQYEYMVINGQTVLVDPNTRHVVQIIQE